MNAISSRSFLGSFGVSSSEYPTGRMASSLRPWGASSSARGRLVLDGVYVMVLSPRSSRARRRWPMATQMDSFAYLAEGFMRTAMRRGASSRKGFSWLSPWFSSQSLKPPLTLVYRIRSAFSEASLIRFLRPGSVMMMMNLHGYPFAPEGAWRAASSA